LRILVTGGAGYIGSHVAKALAEAGHQPRVLDNFCMGNRWAVQWGPLIEGDLSDRAALAAALDGADAVVHLAAFTYVGESAQNPGKYYRNNFGGALRLLDAMAASGVRDLVFSSTCAVYGTPDRVPIPESHARRPVSPYGESKLFVERALAAYGASHGIRYVSLRYFNAAGADAQRRIGEMHRPETHLIPLAIYAALGLRPDLHVFGTDYSTPDGTAIRDYIHVDDLARGHLLALEYLKDGGASTALNLGTGHGHSVREVVRAVEKQSGARVKSIESPRREGDPPALVADATLARRVLNWTPQCSDLIQIVASALDWHRHALAAGLHSEE
jgi:UDP-glucose-4-epimerase GalE